MNRKTGVTALACGLLLTGFCGAALADGRVVDKVYHPYVQPYEQEFEYRYVYQKQTSIRTITIWCKSWATAGLLPIGWRWNSM